MAFVYSMYLATLNTLFCGIMKVKVVWEAFALHGVDFRLLGLGAAT